MTENEVKERYSVGGNIGRFKKGQMLETDKDIVEYYRTVLNEGRDKPSEMTDAEILEAVRSVKGDGEDEEIARIEAMEENN